MKIFGFQYAASFNTQIGDFAVGDETAHSVDFVGDDLEELIKEVWEDDKSYFEPNGYVERFTKRPDLSAETNRVVAVLGLREVLGDGTVEEYPACLIYRY